MPVPKKRTSHSKRNTRRSHHALTAPAATKCPSCGKLTLPHHACVHCGFYRGQQVIKV